MRKLISLLLVFVMAFACLSGCSSNAVTSTTEENAAASTEATEAAETTAAPEATDSSSDGLVVDLSNITIGASVMSLQHEFMANLVVGYKEFQRQTNINILITDGGNMEPEKQVTNVENYITQNVDGILCQCISVETMKDTLQRAIAAGIPVGIYPYDRSVGVTTYFGYNEYTWGYSLGEAAAAWVNDKLGGKAKIISLTTSLEESARERCRGWTEAANSILGEENIDWVTVEATSSEDAMANIESALQANPDTNLVLVFNDEMGIGAYEAVTQSGLDTTNMFLGSCDGTDSVLDLVAQNTVYRCTVANDRYVSEIGFYWAENMVKIVLGMEYDDPFPITTMAVTYDNVAAYRSREPSYVIDQDLIDYVNSHK